MMQELNQWARCIVLSCAIVYTGSQIKSIQLDSEIDSLRREMSGHLEKIASELYRLRMR